MKIKAVKIKQSLFEFLEEHPELTFSTDANGNLTITFPEDAENVSYTNFLGNISILYNYNGNSVRFPE